MANDDDRGDRPKKSWREIDAKRNQSAHHGRGDAPSQAREEKLQRSGAYRQYKSELEKVFSGGGLPELMKAKLAEAGGGGAAEPEAAPGVPTKKESRVFILDATTPSAIREALATYRAAFGFPDDEEVLGKLLDLEDGPILLESLGALSSLRDAGPLKRTVSLKGRLKTVLMTVDDDDAVAAAKALLARL